MKGVLRKFPGGFKNVKGQIQRRLRNVSRETFQRCFKEISGGISECFHNTSWLFQGSFKKASRKVCVYGWLESVSWMQTCKQFLTFWYPDRIFKKNPAKKD